MIKFNDLDKEFDLSIEILETSVILRGELPSEIPTNGFKYYADIPEDEQFQGIIESDYSAYTIIKNKGEDFIEFTFDSPERREMELQAKLDYLSMMTGIEV